jgi:serine protease inhibitor
LNQKFSAIAEHDYWAKAENLNFNDARNAAKTINNFVKEATENRITELVTEEAVSNAVILLVNALYFDGKWRHSFNKTSTKPFNTKGGKKISKTFMEHTRNYYYFNSANLSSKIVRLPYAGDKFSMFVILPKENVSLDEVIKKLNHKDLSEEVKQLEELEVHVALPRFKFDTSVNLNEAIKAVSVTKLNYLLVLINWIFQLGITAIFENTATLPQLARGGSSEGKLKVSNIVQKSGIIVNEIGA